MALGDELRNTYVVKKTEPDKTRDQVARTILEGGPATAAALAKKLAITPAGIRRHLDSLISEGVLTAKDPYQSNERGRGRPSKVFVMTDAGREKFEHSYDDLAVAALKFMSAQSGAHLVDAFAQSRADDIERQAQKFISKRVGKVDALADFLTDQGYAASVHDTSHFRVKTWDLLRSRKYGSKHHNEQTLQVTQAKLSPDKKTIHLTIPTIKPTWVMEIQYQVKDDQGILREGLVQNTIHQLGGSTK